MMQLICIIVNCILLALVNSPFSIYSTTNQRWSWTVWCAKLILVQMRRSKKSKLVASITAWVPFLIEPCSWRPARIGIRFTPNQTCKISATPVLLQVPMTALRISLARAHLTKTPTNEIPLPTDTRHEKLWQTQNHHSNLIVFIISLHAQVVLTNAHLSRSFVIFFKASAMIQRHYLFLDNLCLPG